METVTLKGQHTDQTGKRALKYAAGWGLKVVRMATFAHDCPRWVMERWIDETWGMYHTGTIVETLDGRIVGSRSR